MTSTRPPVKLTSLTHGGGCGCKIAPAVLAQILAALPRYDHFPGLLVGAETSDDAAVYSINDEQAVVATTDFFTPIVDDPYDFGRIAAANALSDLYAMGAQPLLAMAIVAMPLATLPLDAIQQVIAGGARVCGQAGIPVAGGHSIDAQEPIYGLVALGIAHPDRIKRNSQAQAGDAVILSKGLGIGILGAALKKGVLSAAGYAQMLSSATQLNAVGVRLAERDDVHALTDVTGFGLLGHLLEVCRASRLRAALSWGELPILPEALSLARQGYSPGAAGRNWASYGGDVDLPAGIAPWQQALLCDPQTNGGLLVTCPPPASKSILALLRQGGFPYARVIGVLGEGVPGITVAA